VLSAPASCMGGFFSHVPFLFSNFQLWKEVTSMPLHQLLDSHTFINVCVFVTTIEDLVANVVLFFFHCTERVCTYQGHSESSYSDGRYMFH